jgi:cbb3-type cytochrome oxidase subunit 3
MRLSELVSHLTPSVFAEIALLLFFFVFAVVSIRAFGRGARAQSQAWAALPLFDDADANAGGAKPQQGGAS